VVQRLRVRYAKRGPLRFTSHRDFARAFERAVRRAGLPVAFSQGFTPHPRISYASAAPTGTASEAEYLEIGLSALVDPDHARAALDAALSPGLDVLDVRAAAGPVLAERLTASRWLVELPGVPTVRLAQAVAAFLAADEVVVERLTKQGLRRFDARAAVISLGVVSSGVVSSGVVSSGVVSSGVVSSGVVSSGVVSSGVVSSGVVSNGVISIVAPTESGAVPDTAGGRECAMMEAVVRQVTPAVRPDDVLAGLRVVAGLEPPVPPRATRLAQGTLTPDGEITDPLEDVGEVIGLSASGGRHA
jgi:radical SAM-linked protein